MISIKNLSIKYVPDFYSLFDLSLEIKDNTFLVSQDADTRIGLMHVIAGIDKCYSGNILIDETEIKKLKKQNNLIAYVPKEIYLFKNKNVLKNIEYSLKIRKIDKTEIKNRVNLIISKYNLQNLINTPTKELTFSESKLVMLLRAIIRQPKYILLEDYFEVIDDSISKISKIIIANSQSIFITCEKAPIKEYESFNKIELSNGRQKKEGN